MIIANSQFQRIDMNLGNRAPRITSLAATDGTKFVTRTTVGQTLKMIAGTRELDGDTVEYTWKLADGQMGALGGSTTDSEKWQLPNTDGNQSVYVMARDFRGGFAFKRFEMQVGIDQIDASGIAVDQLTNQPVRGATVTLGGSTTQTNNTGWFSVSTAPICASADCPKSVDRQVIALQSPRERAGHPCIAVCNAVTSRASPRTRVTNRQ